MRKTSSTVLSIALRQITTRPASSAVAMITAVAVCGVAVATAAIICVLSVFNGFKEFLSDNNNRFIPDIEITPARGKVFKASSVLASVKKMPGVADAWEILTDNALVINQGVEMPVTLKGVQTREWHRNYDIDSVMLHESRFISEPDRNSYNNSQAALSIGAAHQLRFYDPEEKILIFAPRRNGRYNPANPALAFITDSARVTGVYQTRRSEMDENMVITDISVARRLFQYDNEASSIEVKAAKNTDDAKLAVKIQSMLGKDYVVKDRLQQQQMNYRMINIEKWVSALLLVFILLIASFNIISSMSMVIVEKQNSFLTMRSLGLTRRSIGNIFGWQSMMITIVGGCCGIILGIILVLLQSRYGFIHFNGNTESMLISSYPVKLVTTDIFITFGAVTAIGTITALIATAFARSRT